MSKINLFYLLFALLLSIKTISQTDILPCIPISEIANGIDDDCDGLIDEGLSNSSNIIDTIPNLKLIVSNYLESESYNKILEYNIINHFNKDTILIIKNRKHIIRYSKLNKSIRLNEEKIVSFLDSNNNYSFEFKEILIPSKISLMYSIINKNYIVNNISYINFINNYINLDKYDLSLKLKDSLESLAIILNNRSHLKVISSNICNILASNFENIPKCLDSIYYYQNIDIGRCDFYKSLLSSMVSECTLLSKYGNSFEKLLFYNSSKNDEMLILGLLSHYLSYWRISEHIPMYFISTICYKNKSQKISKDVKAYYQRIPIDTIWRKEHPFEFGDNPNFDFLFHGKYRLFYRYSNNNIKAVDHNDVDTNLDTKINNIITNLDISTINSFIQVELLGRIINSKDPFNTNQNEYDKIMNRLHSINSIHKKNYFVKGGQFYEKY